MHPNIDYFIFSVFSGVNTKTKGNSYCPEAPGSPRPAAGDFLRLQGSKSSQLLHGRDFLF